MKPSYYIHSRCCGVHWELVVMDNGQADLLCEKCRKSVGPEVRTILTSMDKLECSEWEKEE